MVGVRGVSGGAVTGKGRARQAGAGGFSLSSATAGEATTAQGMAAAQPIGLLALQEGIPVAERNARARRRGEAALKGLIDLQLALLGGAADPARLAALAAGLPRPEDAAEPALAEALAAIRLRVRVELARHGIDPAPSHD
ncbi:flagellar assembly protein FliX [Roseomonas sp. HJA6]|uniref:Flagellar assembly protein FliX n=1 Tax=Roseomonas alba TaxID=2846776 RepID=A0ABS7ABE8_9PROT|nr:flagellar assembly protein FliX [Neoroseomonas alba]MBW6399625.1 flagellar assembly protein FliX [Neoroseomonas alba]